MQIKRLGLLITPLIAISLLSGCTIEPSPEPSYTDLTIKLDKGDTPPESICVDEELTLAAYAGEVKVNPSEVTFFASSDIVTISGNKVTAISTGDVTITCKSHGYYSDPYYLEINKKRMYIKLNGGSEVPDTICVGDRLTLAAYRNESTKVDNPTFSTSSSGVIMMAGDRVSAIGEGSVTITCEADGYLPATCSFEVKYKEMEIRMADGSAIPDTIYNGETFEIDAFEGSRKITASRKFIPSVTGIINISGNKVTVTGLGSVSITCSAHGYRDVVTQSLTAVPKSEMVIKLESGGDMPEVIAIGTTLTLAACIVSGETVIKIPGATFSSNLPEIVDFTGNQLVTYNAGNVIITCKARGYYDVSCSLEVILRTMQIKRYDGTDMPTFIYVGDSLRIDAFDESGSRLVYRHEFSIDPTEGVATLDVDTITAQNPGTITITCKSKRFHDATYILEVRLRDMEIKLDGGADAPNVLHLGDKLTLAAYDGSTKISSAQFSVSPAGVLMLAGNRISAVGKGEATITCTAYSYKTIEHHINVEPYDVTITEGVNITPTQITTFGEYVGTITLPSGANKILPLELDSVTIIDINSTDITKYCTYDLSDDNLSATITIPEEYLTGNIKIDLTPKNISEAKWYDYVKWWDYCSNGGSEQAVPGDVGKVVRVKINGLWHRVRLIDVEHVNPGQQTSEGHCTFEFADFITKSDGTPIDIRWNYDERGGKIVYNYYFPNSLLNTELAAQVIPVLPEGLKAKIKTVYKQFAKSTDSGSSYFIDTYATKLFPLSCTEINIHATPSLAEGSVYAYYEAADPTQADPLRKKTIVGGAGNDYWLRSPCTAAGEPSMLAFYISAEGGIGHTILPASTPVAPGFCI